ncbi:MAG: SRPBCC family protein [Myxococcota bacterium]
MPTFTGTQSRVFTVKATPEAAMELMSNPDAFRALLPDLDTLEQVEGEQWRFVLKEKSEKGVQFRGDYTVRYTTSGDTLTWTTTSHGNMTSQGRAVIRPVGAGAEIDYTETITADMKVNRLLAKLIKPIVNREIANGVGGYLDRVKAHLDNA